jgi:type IV pilus assembly protein PilE
MHRQRGVTLIELVTVIAIVSILTAIAVPSYANYMRKARRADAKSMLNTAAQQLERCYTRLNSYNDGTNDVSGNCPLALGSNAPGDYSLSIAFDTTAGLPTGQSYTLTATALGKQTRDTACGNFTLDQTGKQGVSLGSVSNCW